MDSKGNEMTDLQRRRFYSSLSFNLDQIVFLVKTFNIVIVSLLSRRWNRLDQTFSLIKYLFILDAFVD